jgi:hypothetical protein
VRGEEEYLKNNLITRLRRPYLRSRIADRLLSCFFFKQWVLLIRNKEKNNLAEWNSFKPLIPPSDRFWADPFLWKHEGKYFIFFEELFYSSHRAHIACITLDNQLNATAIDIVLERPYHLSYPFIFEYQEQIYMLPETKTNHAVELYRCECFPNRWVHVKTLLSNVRVVDSTLLQADNKWWLFSNSEQEDGSSHETLNLYYSADLFSDEWNPHPLNPVVRDIHSARPAGRIFWKNGHMIRPSQDCSVRYGSAINFNKILTLTEKCYVEVRDWTYIPPKRWDILGAHTWNELDALNVIDALVFRRKFSDRVF